MHPGVPARPWLGRYLDPLPIRSRGAYHLVSARRADDGALAVVVVPGPLVDGRKAVETLAEVERVHALLDDPRIPPVARRGVEGSVPFLELACDAVIDGVEALALLGESEKKVPYAQADALLTSLREAAQAAHRVTDPRTGQPICLGRVSYANILFSRSGRWFLIGFGRNFPTEKDTNVPDGSTPIFQAPEVAAGAPPSPIADYVALLLFGRCFLPYIEMAPAIGRILRGELGPGDLELLENVTWFDRRILGAPPPLRATLAEALAVSQRIRDLLGVELDTEGFTAFMAALLAERDDEPTGGGELVIGPEAAWIAGPSGELRRLGRAQRRILVALAERRRDRPGEPISVWELLSAGWPGERPGAEIGANRVYVALARLRAMGLRDALERFEDGYRLSPRAAVRFEDASRGRA